MLSVSSFMGHFTDILMIDKSEKTIENEVKNICLADGRSIGIKLAIKFRVFNSDHFSRNMIGERKKLFLDDIWNELVSGLLCREILPKMQRKHAKDFSGGESVERAKAEIESGVRRKFKDWGLILTSLFTNFNVPPAEEAAADGGGYDEGQELKDAGKRPKPGTMDDEADELERERLEKEVAMELEKKQMQKDVEDAMEALELKDMQERKKTLRGSEADEGKKLAEDLEDLKKAKDITERKFYKKELSEESFQRMMEDFEKRIIEIETKLRTK
jgi:hypothetical protein